MIRRPTRRRSFMGAAFCAAMSLFGSSEAYAQRPLRPGEWEGTPPPTVSVQQVDGLPQLIVFYPWTVHAAASLELALVPAESNAARPSSAAPQSTKPRTRVVLDALDAESQRQARGPQPMYFRSERLSGAVEEWTYRIADEAEGNDAHHALKIPRGSYAIDGRHNLLGRPVVEISDATTNVVALPTLEPWALSPRLLLIDPPRQAFAEAGTLHVWMLRGDTVLWHETVAWPGSAAR